MPVFLKISESSVLAFRLDGPKKAKRDGYGCSEPRILERIGILVVLGGDGSRKVRWLAILTANPLAQGHIQFEVFGMVR